MNNTPVKIFLLIVLMGLNAFMNEVVFNNAVASFCLIPMWAYLYYKLIDSIFK